MNTLEEIFAAIEKLPRADMHRLRIKLNRLAARKLENNACEAADGQDPFAPPPPGMTIYGIPTDEWAALHGVKPIDDPEAFIEEFRDLWPDEKEIDEFLAWLDEVRHGVRRN